MPVWAIVCAHFCENWGFYTMLTQLPTFMSGQYTTRRKNFHLFFHDRFEYLITIRVFGHFRYSSFRHPRGRLTIGFTLLSHVDHFANFRSFRWCITKKKNIHNDTGNNPFVFHQTSCKITYFCVFVPSSNRGSLHLLSLYLLQENLFVGLTNWPNKKWKIDLAKAEIMETTPW